MTTPKKKVLIVGGNGGVGTALIENLGSQYVCTAPTSNELDLSDFSSVDAYSLVGFDIIIIAAAYNVGAFRGWLFNQSYNQVNQVLVNHVGPLLLIKNFVRDNSSGHIIAYTSTNIEDPWPQNLFYTTSKMALKMGIDILRTSYPSFVFSEICLGKTKTKMLEQNYGDTKTDSEIQEMYATVPHLDANYVANVTLSCIQEKSTRIVLRPNGES